MTMEEQSFPRGGAEKDPVKSVVRSDVYGESKPKQSKKTKSKTVRDNRVIKYRNGGAAPGLTSLNDLSPKILTEGMRVLACINEITDYYLELSLPGFITGRVLVTQISAPYSELLQSASESDEHLKLLCPLNELFYKGQLVCGRVCQITTLDDGRHRVFLSLDPQLVHEDCSHYKMAVKGLIITAAVKSKEEHGYVMDCGIDGLNSFLKEDRASNYCETFNGGRPLAIGQLVRCIVMKADLLSVSSSIELSADPNDIAERESKDSVPVDIQNLLPGMRFKLSVTEIMKNGVRVEFSKFSGYVHRKHIPNGNLEPGTTVFGRVLYITPIVKHIFLSVMSNVCAIAKKLPEPSLGEIYFRFGDRIEDAQVTETNVGGLSLLLKKKGKIINGFVPLERIDGIIYEEENREEDGIGLKRRLRKKFRVGKSVCCRLLHFNSLMETYVCSMQKKIIREKYFSIFDVNVGDVVPCVVKNVNNDGINVRLGKLVGYVPNYHSADIPLHQPAVAFPVNSQVSGRILKIYAERRNVLITFKKSLVSTEAPILKENKDAQIGCCYFGTVSKITAKNVIVLFFGEAFGMLRRESCKDQTFILGQLLKCYVIKQEEALQKGLLLSLTAPPGAGLVKSSMLENCDVQDIDCKDSQVAVGDRFTAEVISVNADGLVVKLEHVERGSCGVGIIPIFHLWDDPKMCQSLFDVMEIGTELAEVWCISIAKPTGVILSMRYSVAQFFQSHEGECFETVKKGWNLPCTIQDIKSDCILIQSVFHGGQTLTMPWYNVCNEKEDFSSLDLVKHQGIQAKILQNGLLSYKEANKWNGKLVTSILQLSSYISIQQSLYKHAIKSGKPIGTCSVGGEFKARVCQKMEWGYILSTPNGVRGELTFFNAQSDQLEIGSEVTGKVINIDCIRKYVDVTLHPKISAILNNVNDKIEPHIKFDGYAILVTPEFILIQITQKFKGRLAYIPTYLDPLSRSQLSLPEPFFGIKQKFTALRCSSGNVLCVPRVWIRNQKVQLKPTKKKRDTKTNENFIKIVDDDGQHGKKKCKRKRFKNEASTSIPEKRRRL